MRPPCNGIDLERSSIKRGRRRPPSMHCPLDCIGCVSSATPTKPASKPVRSSIERHRQPFPAQNRTSSISKLPIELLSEIMVQLYHSLTSPLDRFRLVATMQIISRLWRRATLWTPALWTNLHLSSPIPFNHVPIRLTRSGVLPLDFFIDVEDDDSLISEGERLMALILPCAGRWRKMDIRSSSLDVAILLSTLSKANLSMLEFLAVDTPMGMTDSRRLMFRSAPSLQTVQLSGYQLDWTQCSIQGLRRLSVSEYTDSTMDINGFLQVLQASPNLESLELQGVTVMRQQVVVSARLPRSHKAISSRCVHLERMILKGTCPWGLFLLLSYIDAPHLRYLFLETLPGPSSSSHETQANLSYIRSTFLFPQLEHLELGEMTSPSLNILYHLTPPPHLSLDCEGTSIARELARFLHDEGDCAFAQGVIELTAYGIQEHDLDILTEGDMFPNLVEFVGRLHG